MIIVTTTLETTFPEHCRYFRLRKIFYQWPLHIAEGVRHTMSFAAHFRPKSALKPVLKCYIFREKIILKLYELFHVVNKFSFYSEFSNPPLELKFADSYL